MAFDCWPGRPVRVTSMRGRGLAMTSCPCGGRRWATGCGWSPKRKRSWPGGSDRRYRNGSSPGSGTSLRPPSRAWACSSEKWTRCRPRARRRPSRVHDPGGATGAFHRGQTMTEQSRRATLAAIAAMVTAGACWGLAAVMAKTAFDRGVSPVRMAEARVVVALAVLGGILAWRRRDLLRPPAGTGPVLIVFGLSVAGVNSTYYVAIDRLAVGVAISLQYTAPVLLLGWSAITAKTRAPGRVVWLAAGLTLAGAVLVSRAYGGLSRVNGIGLLAAVGSAVTFATYLLTAGRAGRRGVHPATVLFWGFVVAVLTWSVIAPWWSWPVARLADTEVTLSVLGVGIVGTLIPFLLAVGALRLLQPATAGIAATVEPPFAAAFAWLLLGQHLSLVQIAGGILVLAGVALAQRAPALMPEALALEPVS